MLPVYVGPSEKLLPCALPLSTYVAVLFPMSSVSCICRASPAYACFVLSTSDSSPVAIGLALNVDGSGLAQIRAFTGCEMGEAVGLGESLG
jgi:hypothetical protein